MNHRDRYLISDDYGIARFLLASGAFGDSLNHAYRSDMEDVACKLLYGFDESNELNVKAHLLKRFSEDVGSAFASRLAANGIFVRYVDEAWKNFEAARGALNDMLVSSKRRPIPKEVLVNPDVRKLRNYLEDCLSFEKFDLYEVNQFDLRHVVVKGPFLARAVTVNYRQILYDIVVMEGKRNRRATSTFDYNK